MVDYAYMFDQLSVKVEHRDVVIPSEARGGGYPRITIELHAGRSAVTLTVDEVRRLADALVKATEAADKFYTP
jgi:hypothetical protein